MKEGEKVRVHRRRRQDPLTIDAIKVDSLILGQGKIDVEKIVQYLTNPDGAKVVEQLGENDKVI